VPKKTNFYYSEDSLARKTISDLTVNNDSQSVSTFGHVLNGLLTKHFTPTTTLYKEKRITVAMRPLPAMAGGLPALAGMVSGKAGMIEKGKKSGFERKIRACEPLRAVRTLRGLLFWSEL